MRVRLLSLLLAIGLTTTVSADPIEWVFEGVDFINGNGSITGSFFYDADTNTTTDFNVSASAGTLILCVPATPPDTGCASFDPAADLVDATFTNMNNGQIVDGATNFFLSGDGQNTQLVISLATLGLTNAGGTVDVIFGAQWQCPSADFCGRNILSTPFRTAVIGTISAVGVPEPGTLALLGIGLAGMGLARRRKKA